MLWKSILEVNDDVVNGHLKDYLMSKCIDFMLKTGKNLEDAISYVVKDRSVLDTVGMLDLSSGRYGFNMEQLEDDEDGERHYFEYETEDLLVDFVKCSCIFSKQKICCSICKTQDYSDNNVADIHKKHLNILEKGCMKNNTEYAVLVTCPDAADIYPYRIHYIPTLAIAQRLAKDLVDHCVYSDAYIYKKETGIVQGFEYYFFEGECSYDLSKELNVWHHDLVVDLVKNID